MICFSTERPSMNTRSVPLAVLLFATASILPVAAQTFGEITGTVTDSTAASVAGVKITITNTGTRQTREVETSAAGSFTVPFLAPGIYQIAAEKQGFKTATRKGVQLQVADSVRVDFTIEVGSVTES